MYLLFAAALEGYGEQQRESGRTSGKEGGKGREKIDAEGQARPFKLLLLHHPSFYDDGSNRATSITRAG